MSIESVAAPQPESSLAARPSRAPSLALGAAALTMGLLAGLFYAYSVSVMPGLGQADDRTLVDGMQQINEAIENPVFFLSFLGAPVLILAALVLEHRSGSRQVVRWVGAALVLCVVAIVVTGALNIPLNDDLKQAGDPERIADIAQARDDFYGPWVAWNIVRTVASTAALGCLVYALLLQGRGTSTPSAPRRSESRSMG
jgi:uncharacterized membrane protein